MKICLLCKRFYYSQATSGYSEYTPRSEFDLHCWKGHWNFNVYETTQQQYYDMLKQAETCLDYEKNPEIKE